jgi:hypothetical protein
MSLVINTIETVLAFGSFISLELDHGESKVQFEPTFRSTVLACVLSGCFETRPTPPLLIPIIYLIGIPFMLR